MRWRPEETSDVFPRVQEATERQQQALFRATEEGDRRRPGPGVRYRNVSAVSNHFTFILV